MNGGLVGYRQESRLGKSRRCSENLPSYYLRYETLRIACFPARWRQAVFCLCTPANPYKIQKRAANILSARFSSKTWLINLATESIRIEFGIGGIVMGFFHIAALAIGTGTNRHTILQSATSTAISAIKERLKI